MTDRIRMSFDVRPRSVDSFAYVFHHLEYSQKQAYMKSDTLSYLFDVSIDNYDLYGELEDLIALKEMLEAKARLAEEAIINHGVFPNHDEDGNLIVDFGNGKQVVIEK